jgi:hypothetical protein
VQLAASSVFSLAYPLFYLPSLGLFLLFAFDVPKRLYLMSSLMKRSNPIAIPTLHTFIAMYHYFDQLFWQGFFLKSYTLTQLSVS